MIGVPVLVLLLALMPGAAAAEAPSQPPRIAIIIDDIGDRYPEGRAAVELPGPVACAFLPHTPHARRLARAAHEAGKEVLLHLPLQAGKDDRLLGPGAIMLNITEAEFRRQLQANLAAVPHVQGVNNHMGSLLTRHPGHMTWLMRELAAREALYFVDSYTHPDSVALRMAHESGVPAARRDVFLDHHPVPDAIEEQFLRLVGIARRRGSAIGIGHPHPETMAFLADVLPRLVEEHGVELVPVSRLLDASATRWVEQPALHPIPPTH